MIWLVFFSFILKLISAFNGEDIFVLCPTQDTQFPTKNNNSSTDQYNPYYYPYPWWPNSYIPRYKSNQFCKWTVVIPDRTFINFTMIADIADDSALMITDSNGNQENIMTSDLQPYVFVGNKFTINLIVGANGNSTKFGFVVQWSPFPTPNPVFYHVNKTSPALFFDEMLYENSVTITAETRATIVAFPSTYPDFTPLLRITLVFDGPDLNSPYLGTLFQALRSNKPMVSNSKQMTVFTFQENYIVGSNFVVQDYYNVQSLSATKGVTCWSDTSCPVTLNAAKGPVSAMTLNPDDGKQYVKQLALSPNSVLKIYNGARREGDDSNLITTYNCEQSKTSIPQKFYGTIVTYYLANGTALVELAEDSNFTRWNDASDGRQGFISSRRYGKLDFFQDVKEEIGGLDSNQTFSFEINVIRLDVSNSAELVISFKNATGEDVHKFSKENNYQSRVFQGIGRNMTVQYNSNGEETSGFYLHFKIEAHNGCPGNYFTMTAFLLLFLPLLY
ncbi:CUB-like domain-containing protein [Caenorhabditis elegans]|uniref:CUB-like domain-containing protein n=1 Tax=Caenorhabditis elegans TaxID=6239 RepID=H9G311_CAEEL|nr:CUB-like domain-containing protein [Caenorhabditis elegans]CCG28078.1 CUB-like domain-containing protein [Caenorhabditis elegans]|eukprot:NP_001255691.1 Uncharacterized protein CELE_K10D11.3 [Caenorhabditis elegans]